MRWQRLFAELEHELSLEESDDELEREESRMRANAVDLRGRVIEWSSSSVEVTVDNHILDIAVQAVGSDWLSGRGGDGRTHVVPLCAVRMLRRRDEPGTTDPVAESPSVSVAIVLRDLARRRVVVQVSAAGRLWCGTLDGAWADHCGLAVHPLDDICRASAIRDRVLLPYRELALVSLEGQVG